MTSEQKEKAKKVLLYIFVGFLAGAAVAALICAAL